MKIALYTGPQCSLCDQAADLLAQVKTATPLTVHTFNIRNDTQLYHQYAVRIPVLKREDNGRELGWPFDLHTLEQFLK